MADRLLLHKGSAGIQAGQALLESLAVLAGIAVLWVAVHWLAHYQDMALSATHAGGYAAFLATREGSEAQRLATLENGEGDLAHFFSGSAHRWTDRRGKALPVPDVSVSRSRLSHPALPAQAQPGGSSAVGSTLRREWRLEDAGIVQAQVDLNFQSSDSISNIYTNLENNSLLQLGMFDQPYAALSRQTSILVDAGHAVSDDAVQTRVGTSRSAWASAHTASRNSARDVVVRAADVDAAWGRADPQFDWLHPWSGRVPVEFIENYEGG